MPETPEVIASRNRALELDKAKRFGTAITPPTGPQESLQTVLGADASQIKYSESGSVGAILVKPGQGVATGAAIKIEDTSSVKVAQKCSEVMGHFFQNANGPAPFSAPRVQVYDAQAIQSDANLNAQLKGTLDSLKNTPSGQRGGFEDTERSYANLATGESAVMVMEFAEGQQLNRLANDDKLGLMKSEAFAQSIGKAMAPSIVLGLNDHLGIYESGGHKANVSNLMYSPDSGTLSVIDYSSSADTSNPGSLTRVGEPDAAGALAKMRTFLEKATESPEAFEKTLTDMVNTSMKDSGRLANEIPFKSVMNSFIVPGADSMFQKKDEMTAFTEEERKQFAANLLMGAIDGLEYAQNNQQALENAVNQTHEVDGNGNTVEHFYTQQEMGELRSELNKLDTQKLKANIGQCMDARQQSMKNAVNEVNGKIQGLQDRMDTVEKEIQRVRNLPPPTMMERLKTFLGGKDKHSVTTLSDEREKLKEDLRTLYAEKPAALAAAQNKVELAEFNEKIQTQAKLPPLPPLPPPGNTTNTVTDTTSLGNGQSQGQGQDAPHTQVHTRDMVKVDFHPQSQGDGLGEKMDETAPKVGTGNPNSLRNQHRELDPSQQQKTKGPTVGQQHEQQHHGLS